MCLIAFAWRSHPDYPLVLAANRDEFHAREATPMEWWQDRPTLLGGRDRQAGGTWLAVARNGRLATVTNFREHNGGGGGAPRSRGEIVTDFASGNASAQDFAKQIDANAYAGYSALFFDGEELVCTSNRTAESQALQPGVYGLSNAALDTPWPKLVASREALRTLLGQNDPGLDDLFAIVSDRTLAADADLAGMPFAMARALSAAFIVTPEYGTRCSTAFLQRSDGHIEIGERRFDPRGNLNGESRFVFVVTDAGAQPAP